MPKVFAALGRNLAAGLRLALFMPIERAAFRISPAQFVLLAVVSAAIDVDADWVRAAHEARFSILGLHSELYALGLLVLTGAVLAALRRDAGLILAIPTVVLAAFPALQIASVVPDLPNADPAMSDATREFLVAAFRVWGVVLCMRAVYVCVDPQRTHRRAWALGGGMLLAAPLWLSYLPGLPDLLGPLDPWWRESEVPAGSEGPVNPASEAALAAQQFLLDRALDDLEDERPGITDLYFIGFAPDARRSGFAADVLRAQQVMDGHWDTRGRSIVLVNSPLTVAQQPYATVTNLRETLLEIGDIIDPDDDVVMVYLAGTSGRDRALAAVNPPLELVPLTPAGLRRLFDAAGIRWRIVVISTCGAGAWIDAMKDADTEVIASSAADVDGRGCESGNSPTAFGEAFFGNAMAHGDDFGRAFDGARERLATRGAAAPVMWAGPEIAEHLTTLRRGERASRIVTGSALPVRYR